MARMPSSPQYRIRGIDPAVWERFIARLQADRVTVFEFFKAVITRYAEGAGSVTLPPQAPKAGGGGA